MEERAEGEVQVAVELDGKMGVDMELELDEWKRRVRG